MAGLNGFNFNNSNQNNNLMDLLQQYIPQQQSPTVEPKNEPTRNTSGSNVYEIMTNDDLKYIKPDKSGQKQIILCESEKTMYVARYNYATDKPDYEKYISEGNIELFKKPDTSAEMSQIAEALLAVVGKLETMDNAINDIKNAKPKETIKEVIREVPVKVVKEKIKKEPIIDDVSDLLKEIEYKQAEIERLNASIKNRGLVKEAPAEATDKPKRNTNRQSIKKGDK